MDTERSVEQQIQKEIELLRGKFPQTQDLYREACVLLFFRFGITPTANKLYQFVRKGSMSAPAEALGKFWEDLRDKSRVRIEHPDLPDELRTAAGELTAAIWTQAQANAKEGLAAFQAEAQTAVFEARTAQAASEADKVKARSEADSVQTLLTEANARIRNFEQQLAAERATCAAQERQLRQAAEDLRRQEAALDLARREFTSEMEKHRVTSQLAEERYRAAEERALLEIDRERTQAGRLQKELDLARTAASHVADRHRTDILALHTELGQLKQRLGGLEGNLQSALSERDRVCTDAEALRELVMEAKTQAATHRSEAENWRQRAEDARQALDAAQAKSAKQSRKNGPTKDK